MLPMTALGIRTLIGLLLVLKLMKVIRLGWEYGYFNWDLTLIQLNSIVWSNCFSLDLLEDLAFLLSKEDSLT